MRLETIEKYKRQAKALIAQMTLDEKIGQMTNNAQPIERLGIQSYNWWNEALHGVARAGIATVFPQAIALAATFDRELLRSVGDAVATEGRAKFHEFQRKGDHGTYKGLTFWAPNVNIFRDPRWGRGHETYGEDPCLTGQLAVAYIRGLQGEHPDYLKTAACAKHFIAHSGPEACRHGFDAEVTPKDFAETYLPAFKACVQEGGVEAVMGAYNSVNGEICCGSRVLIQELLRDRLGFAGHYVSDCGAVHGIQEAHKAVANVFEAAALALHSGCDLNCGNAYRYLRIAVEEGLVDEQDIDRSLERLLVTRLKLGILGEETGPYAAISYAENDSEEHHRLALRAAEKSMTLLKNTGILPLKREAIRTLAVIGPNADSRAALQGNYYGTASRYYTVLDGLRTYLGAETAVLYAQGCHLFQTQVEACAEYDDRSAEALSAAERADAVVLCVGLDASIEGEQGDAFNGDGSGDKVDLRLPGLQNELMEKILDTGKPVIVVNLSGSAVDLSLAQRRADAVVQAWYPGAFGGLAIARLLFGEYSPAGRLPVTFYRAAEDLPPFEDYGMTGRTYRYFEGPVLYPFGYGLSYSAFAYRALCLERTAIAAGESVEGSVEVANVGACDAEEVVQIYLRDDQTGVRAPRYQLKRFFRVFLRQGETKTVHFTLEEADMQLVLEDGSVVVEPGSFTVFAGGGQPTDGSLRAVFTVR